MVGRFQKGPIETPILISNEDQLVDVFGEPNDINANDWHTVAEFLRYTNACYVVRASNAGAFNATSVGNADVFVPNQTEYNTISGADRTLAGEFVAKNAGTAGNDIAVIAVDSTTWTAFDSWATTNNTLFANDVALSNYFNTSPDTTEYVSSRAADATPKLDEMHILVLDVTGNISGTPYTVLEKFEGVSKASDAVNYKGLSIYYVNVVNESSNYVWWTNHITETTTATELASGTDTMTVAPATYSFAPFTAYYNTTLAGGTTGTASSESEIKSAYDLLTNKDLYQASLIMTGAFGLGTPGAIEKYVLENVAHARKDCIGFVSPHTSGAPIVDAAGAEVTIAAFKTSVGVADKTGEYGFMDTGMKYIFDRYSKKYRWIPMNGDMAGLAARTDATNAPWWSFAGFNRGGLKNVIKFAFNPNQVQRDYLYPKGINPVISDPDSGPTLYGDRTMTTKPSAFDRINVRRLFIVLEKSIAKSAKSKLFEFNDEFTRSQFKNTIEPFLRGIQGERGITEFLVVCDASNNPGEVVDQNQFVASIFIKPSRSINFITLNFVATRTDVAFSTVVGA